MGAFAGTATLYVQLAFSHFSERYRELPSCWMYEARYVSTRSWYFRHGPKVCHQLDERITPFVLLVINYIQYVHGSWSIIPVGRTVKIKIKV